MRRASVRLSCALNSQLGAVRLREEAGTIVGRPTTSELIPRELRELREKERFV